MGSTEVSLNHLVAGEIRAEMARQRRTGVELASHLQITQQAVSRRLSGEASLDLDDVARIADWLGVPLARLIPGLDERVSA